MSPVVINIGAINVYNNCQFGARNSQRSFNSSNNNTDNDNYRQHNPNNRNSNYGEQRNNHNSFEDRCDTETIHNDVKHDDTRVVDNTEQWKSDKVICELDLNKEKKNQISNIDTLFSNDKDAFYKQDNGQHTNISTDIKKDNYNDWKCDQFDEKLDDVSVVVENNNINCHTQGNNRNIFAMIVVVTFYCLESMLNEIARLQTFIRYAGNGPRQELARNGFFHVPNRGPTSTMCNFCQMIRNSWRREDNVEQIHRAENPDCQLYHPSTSNVPIPLQQQQRYINALQTIANGDIDVAQTETGEGSSRLVTNEELATDRVQQQILPIIDVATRTVLLHPAINVLGNSQQPIHVDMIWFYHAGVADFIRCNFCGAGIRNWNNNVQIAAYIHGRFSPRCPAVEEIRNYQHAITHIHAPTTDVAQTNENVEEMRCVRGQLCPLCPFNIQNPHGATLADISNELNVDVSDANDELSIRDDTQASENDMLDTRQARALGTQNCSHPLNNDHLNEQIVEVNVANRNTPQRSCDDHVTNVTNDSNDRNNISVSWNPGIDRQNSQTSSSDGYVNILSNETVDRENAVESTYTDQRARENSQPLPILNEEGHRCTNQTRGNVAETELPDPKEGTSPNENGCYSHRSCDDDITRLTGEHIERDTLAVSRSTGVGRMNAPLSSCDDDVAGLTNEPIEIENIAMQSNTGCQCSDQTVEVTDTGQPYLSISGQGLYTESEMSETSAEMSEASSEMNKSSSAMSIASSTMSEASSTMSVASSEMNKVSSKMSEASSEMSTASSEMSEASSEISVASSEMSEASSKMNKVSSEMSEASSEMNKVSSKMSEASSEMSEASSEISVASSEMSEASSEMSEASSEMSEASSEISVASSKMSVASSKMNKVSSEMSEASSEISDALSEMGDDSSEMSEASSEMEDYCTTLTSVENATCTNPTHRMNVP